MDESSQLRIPEAGRPVPLEGYGVPDSEEGLLPWSFVRERMTAAKNYWISTTMPDGQPHARPVWGVWMDDRLHFGGGPNTRWSKNLKHDPRVTAHLESGSEVVIIEGVVTVIDQPDDPRIARLDALYKVKYDIEHGIPIWNLAPRKVFAWSDYPVTVTRWVFE